MQDDRPVDFPAEERYTDCAGRAITFALSCHRMPLGWRVAAVGALRAGADTNLGSREGVRARRRLRKNQPQAGKRDFGHSCVGWASSLTSDV